MSYAIRHLANPTEVELVAASKVLATAFKDDDFTQMTVGHDPELTLPFVNSVLIAGSMEGEIYVAEDAASKIVGVAVWFGPGMEFFHSEAQQEKALIPLLAHFEDDLQAWWNDVNSLMEESLGPGKLLDSWHLQLIGVMPDHRKKRLATRMIETVRDKVHPEGLDLVLEPTTEAKKQFYERMGFISKGVKPFTGLKGDECRMWSMIWPAPAQESSTSTAE